MVIIESKKESVGVYCYLLMGVFYMLLMVVVGGLCIVFFFVFGIEVFKELGMLAAVLM